MAPRPGLEPGTCGLTVSRFQLPEANRNTPQQMNQRVSELYPSDGSSTVELRCKWTSVGRASSTLLIARPAARPSSRTACDRNPTHPTPRCRGYTRQRLARESDAMGQRCGVVFGPRL